MHNSAVLPEPPKVIENSNNPPKLGRAFYFEIHGMQVLNVRTFSIDVSNKKKENNLDDKPFDLCAKGFPQVSKKRNDISIPGVLSKTRPLLWVSHNSW